MDFSFTEVNCNPVEGPGGVGQVKISLRVGWGWM